MDVTTRTVRCPDNERGPDDVVGCGKTFEVTEAEIADDPDHWVDCPHCGIFFDPVLPDNGPQPEPLETQR